MRVGFRPTADERTGNLYVREISAGDVPAVGLASDLLLMTEQVIFTCGK